MAQNGRPRWKLDRIGIGILIALLAVLGVTEYRHWAEDRRVQRASFDKVFSGMAPRTLLSETSSLPAPPFDPNNVGHCSVLNMSAGKAIRQGLLEPQNAERLSQLMSKLRPLPANDLVVISDRLLSVNRLIETGDRAALGSAVSRCTELISAELKKQ